MKLILKLLVRVSILFPSLLAAEDNPTQNAPQAEIQTQATPENEGHSQPKLNFGGLVGSTVHGSVMGLYVGGASILLMAAMGNWGVTTRQPGAITGAWLWTNVGKPYWVEMMVGTAIVGGVVFGGNYLLKNRVSSSCSKMISKLSRN